MCGVIPYQTRMQQRLSLGYREARLLADSPLGLTGQILRGHEFHFSCLKNEPTQAAYTWKNKEGQEIREGYANGNILASYLHLHYGASSQIVDRLLASCRA